MKWEAETVYYYTNRVQTMNMESMVLSSPSGKRSKISNPSAIMSNQVGIEARILEPLTNSYLLTKKSMEGMLFNLMESSHLVPTVQPIRKENMEILTLRETGSLTMAGPFVVLLIREGKREVW